MFTIGPLQHIALVRVSTGDTSFYTANAYVRV